MSTLNVVVTGCASGIGLHLAKAFAARGHRVLATDINEDALRAARFDGEVRTKKLDVRSETDWAAVIDDACQAFGDLDVLLNVAGFLNPAYVVDITARDVDLHLDVNVKGVIYGTRAAARRMVEQRHGHIINIGSLASLAPVPGLPLYSASKFAVRGFSLSAAGELEPFGVHVSLVMPDAVQTPMLDKQVDYKEAALTFSGSKPLTVDDIERVIFDKVLTDKPIEVAIPTSRGLLAKIANTAPQLARALAPALAKKGQRAQEKLKRK